MIRISSIKLTPQQCGPGAQVKIEVAAETYARTYADVKKYKCSTLSAHTYGQIKEKDI